MKSLDITSESKYDTFELGFVLGMDAVGMDKPLPSFSAHKVRELLYEQDRTQEWLAEQTGYTPEMISRYMNGRSPISLKFAAKAARVLGVPIHWLEEATVAA